MSKKVSKFGILIIILLFALTIPIYAREVTIEDIGKEIDRIQKQDSQTIDSYYIIGNYVFTSKYKLDTRDMMLAARSIETNNEFDGTNKDEALKDMTIHEVARTFDNKYNPTGWEIKDNYVGETKIEKNTKLNINYIDYEYFYEEVDTDKLLEDAIKDIQKNNFYGVTFDKDTLSFNIYDLNAKNSEITNTGLVIMIRDILKNENIESLTVTYGGETFTFNSSEMSEERKSKAYEELQRLLAKIAGEGKEFSSMVQGDLVGKELELTVKLNEKKARSQNYKTEESYKVEFVYNAKATISDKIPEKDVAELKSTFNYTTENTYKIEGKDGNYKVTGYVTEQDNITGFGSNPSKYYFAYTITLDEGVDSTNVTVKVPRSDKPEETGYNEAKFEDGKNITVLMEVEESEQTKYRDIIIEVNGVPTRIRIDFSELKLEKQSKFTITGVDKADADDDNKTSWDGWTEGEGYKTEFTVDENDPHKVKVTGLLPIFNQEDIAEDSNLPENILYYLAFKLQTELGTMDSTGVENVEFIQDDKETLGKENFDDKKDLYVLKYLNNNAEDGSEITADKKKFDITLDWDGEEDVYSPYTITVDWSELVLQDYSRGNFGNYDVVRSEKDLEEESDEAIALGKWGYDYDAGIGVEVDTKNDPENGEVKQGLKGTIKEQKLNKEAGFDNDGLGYYVPVKVTFPGKDKEGNTIEGLEKYANTWTLILNLGDGRTKEYTPSPEEHQQGWVLVLFRIKENGDKVIKYQIDFDGSPKEDGSTGYDYLPQEYDIKFDELSFVALKTVTFKYKDKDGNQQTISEETMYEGETIGHDLTESENTDYREFDGWYDSENDTKVESIDELGEKKDVTLEAHWNLDVETFTKDVVDDLNSPDEEFSDNFSEKFDLTPKENNITINIKKPNLQLTELAETSIPGTIAYVLQKGEIKDITLTVGSQKVKITSDYTASGDKEYEEDSDRNKLDEEGAALKKEIIEGAKDAFDKELSGKEESATLDQLEFADEDDKIFTIEIGEPTDKTVKLVDAEGNDLSQKDNKAKKTYTFKFDSDFAVVNQTPTSGLGAKSIGDALSEGNNYSTIYVDGDINETETINITAPEDETKTITIEPVENASSISKASATTHTIKVEGKDNVIDVKPEEGKSVKVTISDLKLSGGKKAELKVEKGANVKVNNLDVSMEEVVPEYSAGIIVAEGGKLECSNITNSNESYNVPTIRAIKEKYTPNDSETVKLNTKMFKNKIYTKVVKQKGDSDKATSVNDNCYYINENNSKLYSVAFRDLEQGESGYVYALVKYYYYGDKIDKDDIESFNKTYITKHEKFEKWVDSEQNDIDYETELKGNDTSLIYFAKYKTE